MRISNEIQAVFILLLKQLILKQIKHKATKSPGIPRLHSNQLAARIIGNELSVIELGSNQ
ncbi:hypothetical protein D3C72_828070 [compost metagenome]